MYRVSFRRRYETSEWLSWLIGTIAVTTAWMGLDLFRPWRWGPWEKWSLIGILSAFLLHELAHRLIASYGGFRSRFRLSPPWLLVTFLSAILPIKVIAPGYVEVSTYIPRSPLGFRWLFYSVAGGPATNMIIAVISLPFVKLDPAVLPVTMINSYVALFNLLPIPPLDGSKIYEVSRKIWAYMIIIAAVLLGICYIV